MSTLELAQLASSFKHLQGYVHVSTAYANSFLPDGLVEEKVYELGDAEAQLQEILETGTLVTEELPAFPWPYAFSKHLAERLLLLRHPNLPILIVRPTIIGHAISQPYPHYGPQGACPLSTYVRGYLQSPDNGVFHVAPTTTPGSNLLDEIPVDLVANLILLHLCHGTTGVIHAGSQSYVPRCLAQLHAEMCSHGPRNLAPKMRFEYVQDKRVKQGRCAEFWQVMGRDWLFSNAASEHLKGVKGPLTMDISDHDAGAFMNRRIQIIADEIETPYQAKL